MLPVRACIYVAMSGGVDSSVSAYLLKQRGYDVHGVYMTPWRPFGTVCRADQDEADARAVATQLAIPFEVWDFADQYGALVAEPMFEAYRTGTTPNPDVGCNQFIKFGAFYREALKRGADAIATGHYAKVRTAGGRPFLYRGVDPNKDQSYFLWGTPPDVLERLVMPVGGLRKPQVRRIAAEAGLTTATKKDSQGVCFVGMLDMKEFLKTRIPSTPGDILNMAGKRIGTHDGAAYYTIGQRHGMAITNGDGPYYVIAKDVLTNTVTIGPESALLTRDARMTGCVWFGTPPRSGQRVLVQIRYRTPAVPAILGEDGAIRFSTPVRAVAPGQSAVVYAGRRLIGGGVLI